MKIGRNDPCHCGSTQRYKKCCLPKDEAARSAEIAAEGAARAAAAAERAKGAAGAPGTPAKGWSGGQPPPGAGPRPKAPVRPGSALIRKRAV